MLNYSVAELRNNKNVKEDNGMDNIRIPIHIG